LAGYYYELLIGSDVTRLHVLIGSYYAYRRSIFCDINRPIL